MWADAKRDGRPAEYRWHSLVNAAVWLTSSAQVPCSNPANIGERKNWTHSQFCTWQNSARAPKNVYNVPAQETAKHRAEFG